MIRFLLGEAKEANDPPHPPHPTSSLMHTATICKNTLTTFLFSLHTPSFTTCFLYHLNFPLPFFLLSFPPLLHLPVERCLVYFLISVYYITPLRNVLLSLHQHVSRIGLPFYQLVSYFQCS
ncbi:uncharacterized protein BO95DRAFT_50484 [Aspergillus brunneoviolaceus CBS 621.78]|uniref:Uncharacterized protein n=1 Tax=Aspergillus brunneoviolaceus CBS 621.78 TaxID=1450534 RepID=A0ACD1GGY3_9EURO|nr:hypothetical protein BO95DRAFT_50484 [Aspergillus brunneoviolaceus CBS 621.78]RAH48507.1 hypothetical protein BO95DRAFT_50484 [Aspergillus brunneoviolaceus CBS 621.78]